VVGAAFMRSAFSSKLGFIDVNSPVGQAHLSTSRPTPKSSLLGNQITVVRKNDLGHA
jgi:hypothetical protein